MKRIIFLLLIVLLGLPDPAFGVNHYWGLSLDATRHKTENLTLKLNDFYISDKNVDLADKSKTLFGITMVSGLDFNWAGNIPLRLELETSLQQGYSADLTVGHMPPPLEYPLKVRTDLDVAFTARAGINLWLQIPVGKFPIKPYVGGGAGVTIMRMEATRYLFDSDHPDHMDYNEKVPVDLEYMLGGGAYYQVGKRTFLDLNIRRTVGDTKRKISFSDSELSFESESTTMKLGFRYYF